MARAQTSEARPVRFRGTPLSMAALVTSPVDPLADIIVSLEIPRPDGETSALDAQVAVEGDPRILRLSLPAAFPPGVYEGSATLAGVKQRVVAEVEAQPALRVFPERLAIESPAGKSLEIEVSVLNTGNVAVDVRRNHLVGIFLEGGMERAIRRAYVSKLEKDQRRIDVLAETLAESHGGLVTVTVAEGAGEIAPQEARDLRLVLKIPDGLEPGHAYAGNLELETLVYPVRVFVPAATPRSPRTRKKESG